MSKLVIFLSYAGEDQKLANTIATKLTSAFGRAVDLRYMSQFPLGANFRALIDQALDAADILLVVATGREKLTHTFTGYEVGYFRRSQQTRPFIDESQKIDRLIIPMAIFADVPVTLSDIEGIGIGQADRFFFELIDGKLTGRKEDPLYQLLLRMDRILDKTDPSERTAEQQTTDYAKYKEEARLFYIEITELMSTLPLTQEVPKTKITVRLPANYPHSAYSLADSVMFAQSGPTTDIFEHPPSSEFLTWRDFGKCIGIEELALSWKDALTNLVNAGVTGDFSESDQIVFSYDRKRAFRLFVSKSTVFFDRSRALDIYVIPILRPIEVGDLKTTFLSKGLEAGLRYRSLFLEANSPFAPIMFRFGEPDEFRRMVHDLLRELRLLLVRSDDAKLSERQNLVGLFGSKGPAVQEVLGMIEVWNKQKSNLYDAAEKILTRPAPSGDEREAFLGVLQEFCDATRPINTNWLKRVMESLDHEISGGSDLMRSRPEPKKQALSPPPLSAPSQTESLDQSLLGSIQKAVAAAPSQKYSPTEPGRRVLATSTLTPQPSEKPIPA